MTVLYISPIQLLIHKRYTKEKIINEWYKKTKRKKRKEKAEAVTNVIIVISS